MRYRVRCAYPILMLVCLFGCLVASEAQIVFDKPKPIEPLPSPYTINTTREQILQATTEVLKSCLFPFNEKVERVIPIGDKVVTGPIVFAKGVNSQTDLEHYTSLLASDARSWRAGRVSLEIVALPLDEKRSQMQIIAHFQGLSADVSGGGANEKWVDVPSNGIFEDEVMRGLAGKILGIDLSMKRDGRRRILSCEF